MLRGTTRSERTGDEEENSSGEARLLADAMVASAALLWWSSAMVVVVHAMGAGASSIHGFHSGGISGGAEGALMRTRALVEAVEAADDGHVHGGGRADCVCPSSCFVRVYREFREPCASII